MPVTVIVGEAARAFLDSGEPRVDMRFDAVAGRLVECWEEDAGLETYGDAVAEVLEFRASEGELSEMTVEEWREFAATASLQAAKDKARSLGIQIIWDCASHE